MRHDIQILRAVAVLLVVAHHALNHWVPNGMLGVDIFFVISGFLMTQMIVTGIDRGDFTFDGFYLRRARRLLPASLATVAGTVIFAALFLPAGAWPNFIWQVVGALTFTANAVAEQQTNDPVFLRPLAHFWSLALEEQFYLLFPLLLWLSPKKMRPWGVGIVAVESFILFAVFGAGYHLPQRAWELLAGSLVFFARDLPVRPVMNWLALATLPAAIWIGSIPLVVALTAVMLLGKDDWVRSPAIERIGDWSYSIYLIHWPVIVFTTLAYGAEIPPLLGATLIAVIIGLSALQYRYVEQPFRKRIGRNRDLAADVDAGQRRSIREAGAGSRRGPVSVGVGESAPASVVGSD